VQEYVKASDLSLIKASSNKIMIYRSLKHAGSNVIVTPLQLWRAKSGLQRCLARHVA
jgi:hypothetical protein